MIAGYSSVKNLFASQYKMSDLPKRRGRPRAYDPDQALARATEVFWAAGYEATSLDELGEATHMNRPSLYAAFGDKEALYLATLRRYRDAGRAAMRQALSPERPLREGLSTVYAKALDLYLGGEGGARGCLLISTAATEALRRPAVRAVLANSLRAFDDEFRTRLCLAREQGELPSDADPVALTWVASATLDALALRARAGEPRSLLEAMAASTVDLICGRREAKTKRTAPRPTGA
jgi:TetR/AcrR family transcriptional regulator, copper-responsive repressor